jgi:hypothetical protein
MFGPIAVVQYPLFCISKNKVVAALAIALTTAEALGEGGKPLFPLFPFFHPSAFSSILPCLDGNSSVDIQEGSIFSQNWGSHRSTQIYTDVNGSVSLFPSGMFLSVSICVHLWPLHVHDIRFIRAGTHPEGLTCAKNRDVPLAGTGLENGLRFSVL